MGRAGDPETMLLELEATRWRIDDAERAFAGEGDWLLEPADESVVGDD